MPFEALCSQHVRLIIQRFALRGSSAAQVLESELCTSTRSSFASIVSASRDRLPDDRSSPIRAPLLFSVLSRVKRLGLFVSKDTFICISVSLFQTADQPDSGVQLGSRGQFIRSICIKCRSHGPGARPKGIPFFEVSSDKINRMCYVCLLLSFILVSPRRVRRYRIPLPSISLLPTLLFF